MTPRSSWMTRLRMMFTMRWSWVAMSTVVPVWLMRPSRRMMPSPVAGSRLPVGSSASMISGRLTNALAIDTRCCSPPESWCGNRASLPARPTRSSTAGTCWAITCFGLPMTSWAKAMFSKTVLFDSSLKSWKTLPMLRRNCGTRLDGMSMMLRPATQTAPCSGRSWRLSSRSNVLLPDPDGPTRKTNSPFATSKLASRSATTSFW